MSYDWVYRLRLYRRKFWRIFIADFKNFKLADNYSKEEKEHDNIPKKLRKSTCNSLPTRSQTFHCNRTSSDAITVRIYVFVVIWESSDLINVTFSRHILLILKSPIQRQQLQLFCVELKQIVRYLVWHQPLKLEIAWVLMVKAWVQYWRKLLKQVNTKQVWWYWKKLYELGKLIEAVSKKEKTFLLYKLMWGQLF